MADNLTREQRSRTMGSIRRRDTRPELLLRSALHAAGLRFRVDMPISVGPGRPPRPDIVFTRARLAVFVDGCFWHGCPAHLQAAKSNAAYWTPKIERNRERDREQSLVLTDNGWQVLRFWEHDDPVRAAREVANAVAARP